MLKVTNAILSARDATLTIGGRTILDKVNLDVRPNEIVTVIGPNGAGKSTLVRCLLGLQPLTSGEIIRSKSLRIGYVPQRFPLLFPHALPLPLSLHPRSYERRRR